MKRRPGLRAQITRELAKGGGAAVLIFALPDSREDLRMAQEGPQARFALQDLAEYLRRRLKYEENPEGVAAVLEAVREELFEILKTRGLDLDW